MCFVSRKSKVEQKKIFYLPYILIYHLVAENHFGLIFDPSKQKEVELGLLILMQCLLSSITLLTHYIAAIHIYRHNAI